jgi:cbb3-type cytochrome oxidase subunit 3
LNLAFAITISTSRIVSFHINAIFKSISVTREVQSILTYRQEWLHQKAFQVSNDCAIEEINKYNVEAIWLGTFLCGASLISCFLLCLLDIYNDRRKARIAGESTNIDIKDDDLL